MNAKNLSYLKTTFIIFSVSLFFLSFKVLAVPIISIDHPEAVKVGDNFDVTINISGVNTGSIWPLQYWSLYLGFSDSMAPTSPYNTNEGYTQGDFGGIGDNGVLSGDYQPGALPRFLQMSQSTNCGQFCSDVFHQESTFSLITIHFKALKYNSAADFVISDSIFKDIYNQNIPVVFDKARPSKFKGWTIVSSPINLVPEPTTITLMSLGLVGLVFSRKRKSV